jgi:hypothetical protein
MTPVLNLFIYRFFQCFCDNCATGRRRTTSQCFVHLAAVSHFAEERQATRLLPPRPTCLRYSPHTLNLRPYARFKKRTSFSADLSKEVWLRGSFYLKRHNSKFDHASAGVRFGDFFFLGLVGAPRCGTATASTPQPSTAVARSCPAAPCSRSQEPSRLTATCRWSSGARMARITGPCAAGPWPCSLQWQWP